MHPFLPTLSLSHTHTHTLARARWLSLSFVLARCNALSRAHALFLSLARAYSRSLSFPISLWHSLSLPPPLPSPAQVGTARIWPKMRLAICCSDRVIVENLRSARARKHSLSKARIIYGVGFHVKGLWSSLRVSIQARMSYMHIDSACDWTCVCLDTNMHTCILLRCESVSRRLPSFY